MLGALIGSYTIDRFGRKFNIMLCSLPLVAGWALVGGSRILSLFYIGRFITGLGMGAVSLTVPVSTLSITPCQVISQSLCFVMSRICILCTIVGW